MADIPVSDPKVAEAVVECLRKCDHALNELLEQTRAMMPEAEYKDLSRGIFQIIGADMFDMWRAIVRHHPQYEDVAYAQGEHNR